MHEILRESLRSVLLNENVEKKKPFLLPEIKKYILNQYKKEYLDNLPDKEKEEFESNVNSSAEEVYEYICETDPVANRSGGKKSPFINQILKWWKENSIIFPEDIQTVSETLNKYNELANTGKIKQPLTDFRTPGDLREKIDEILGIDKNPNEYPVEVVATNGNIKLYRINKFDAEGDICFANSGWCVQHKHMFDTYKPPYYMATEMRDGKEKRLALMHVDSKQIKDVHDRQVSGDIVEKIKPFVLELFKGKLVDDYIGEHSDLFPFLDKEFVKNSGNYKMILSFMKTLSQPDKDLENFVLNLYYNPDKHIDKFNFFKYVFHYLENVNEKSEIFEKAFVKMLNDPQEGGVSYTEKYDLTKNVLNYIEKIRKTPWKEVELFLTEYAKLDHIIAYKKTMYPNEIWEPLKNSLVKNITQGTLTGDTFFKLWKEHFPGRKIEELPLLDQEAIIKSIPQKFKDHIYAQGKRVPEYESIFLLDPKEAYEYMLKNIQTRDPKFEKVIFRSPVYSYELAKMLNQPIPEAEPAIARSAMMAYDYATKILKKPFKLGEPAIMSDYSLAKKYKQALDFWEVPRNKNSPFKESVLKIFSLE